MVLRIVNLGDPFSQWKDGHNSLSTDVGDLSLLQTASASNLVAAINGLDSDVTNFIVNINNLDSDITVLINNGKVTIYDQNGIALN